MSEFYGAADEEEALATIRHALDLGIDFLDTADMYGPFTNEELRRLEEAVPPGAASGERYPDMSSVHG